MFTKTMLSRMFLLLITLSTLGACAPSIGPTTPTGEPFVTPCPTLTPVAVTYNGLDLPTPMPNMPYPTLTPDLSHPESGFGPFIDLQPPPVWLIIGNEAILANNGSNEIYRCGGGGMKDAVPPQEMRDLAIATLPANVQAIIVIGLAAITKFQATVQPWTEEPAGVFFVPESGRELKAEGKSEGDVMVFTLEPTGDAGDQILAVSITFDVGDSYPGSGTYLWRLNPSK